MLLHAMVDPGGECSSLLRLFRRCNKLLVIASAIRAKKAQENSQKNASKMQLFQEKNVNKNVIKKYQ